MEAARHWAQLSAGPPKKATPITVDDGMARVMRQAGATDEQIAQARAELAPPTPEKPDVFEVHPDNWDSWLFFLSVQTQWIFAGMDRARMGLCWQGVEASARMRGVRGKRLQGFADDLVLIEGEVLKTERELAATAARK